MLARRDLMRAAATLPLAAVLADPALAAAAASALEAVEIVDRGGKKVKGALAMPAAAPVGSLVLIHEWWGLNDQIKAVAAEFAKTGYAALAVDLFGGAVATTADAARAQIQGVKPPEATDTLVSWGEWLRREKAAGAKLGSVGWCFGGGWSLNMGLAMPMDATVVYYGNVRKTAAELAPLKGPVQGHFGNLDKSIDTAMVDGFVAAMAEAGKPLEVHRYDADHAFANPTGSRYDEADAKLAWERTQAFLKKNLG